jgi:hypothetical protein
MPRELRRLLALVMLCTCAVNADAQVVHTPHDHVPNFAANPTIRTATHGSWSSPSTWAPARLPTPADVVSIGHTVMYDSVGGDVDVIGIESGGVLRFAPDVATTLRVGILLVLPNGTLEVGTSSNPVTAGAELVIKDKPLNTATDLDQYGTGLLSIDGTVTMHGASKNPTFVRVSTEPRAGHSLISLAQPVIGWRPGDRIFLPDTRQVPADHWFNASYALHVEERIVQSVSADGRTIKQNVVYGGAQLTGAGIAVEDGTETENVFEENFVANIRGSINPRESGPSTADGTTPGSAAECFWAAGFNNRFIQNVVSSCRNPVQQIVSGPGFKFIVPAAPYSARNPRFRGADMMASDQTVSVTPQQQPVLEFRGNEVYGLAADGLTFWQLGTDGYGISPPSMAETLVKDFRVWHTYEGAIWNYPAHRMVADGLVYRIDPAATLYWPTAFQCGDYRNIDITIRGGSIHAGSVFGGCIDPLGQFRIENVDAVARNAAFSFETPATPGTGADRPAFGVTMVLRNNVVRAWPGRSLKTIEMSHNMSRGNSQPQDKYEVLVYDYQGQAGHNFRAYFHPQATQNLYGGVAPCTNTTARPEVNGITCPLSGTAVVPVAPTGVRIIR